MRPKWSKLASLDQKFTYSSFSSSVHSLLQKDNLFKNIFTWTCGISVELLYPSLIHLGKPPSRTVTFL